MIRAPVAVAALVALGACRRDGAHRPPPLPATLERALPPAAPDASTPPPFPSTWVTLGPGARWRGARVAVNTPSPGLVARLESPWRLDWVVLRLDLSRVSLSVQHSDTNRLDAVTADPAVRFAVDPGFFDPDHTPSGLLAANGVTFGAWRPGGGSGVLVVRDGRATVVATPRGAGAMTAPEQGIAVQCGPRLVEQGGVVGIARDDGRRFARTAACVRDGGRTLDLVLTWDPDVPLRGPGLLHFAQRLAGPSPVGDPAGCELALNLDGGPSTAVFLRGANGGTEYVHHPLGPVPWWLVGRDGR